MSIHYNYSLGVDDARLFYTDFGLKYRAYFASAEGYFAGFPDFAPLVQSFGFEILQNPLTTIPHDPKVAATISFILLQYFEINPEGVLFFIHDASDGREWGRKKTFDTWYRRSANGDLIKQDADITIERITILCSILLRADHPLLEPIQQGFERLALEAGQKPED